MHVQSRGPQTHTETTHGQRLTRKQMVDNTTILDRSQNHRKLQVLEAIYIRDHDPTINRQVNARGTLVILRITRGYTKVSPWAHEERSLLVSCRR